MENNTNFQTFHQMGSAINDFVKQATGRDNVQNIDIDHITVAQNHYYADVDVSGSVVSFHAGAAGLPLEKCVVQIEPVQKGSGDPSPDNVRPISGWTGAQVYVSPTTNAADGQTYTIAFPSEAGTVYGGTLDVVSGKLVVDRAFTDLSSGMNWGTAGDAYVFYKQLQNALTVPNSDIADIKSEAYTPIRFNAIARNSYCIALRDNGVIYVNTGSKDIQPTGKAIYRLANPTEIILSPTEVKTLLGLNHVWADTGDIEVKFKDLKELY